MSADDLHIVSGDPVFTFDDEFEVLTWNDAAEEVTGIARADALGRRCWELLGGHDPGGNLVCHPGCSYARIARERHAVAGHELVVKTTRGRRAFALSTLLIERPESHVFLHVLCRPEPGRQRIARPRLTPRQLEVLELLADGIGVKSLAERLGICESTARNHVRAVLAAFGAHSQLEAIAAARRLGVLA